MHKKAFTTTIALIIMIILVSAGVFLIVTKTHNNVTPVEQEVVNSDTQNVSETSNEVQISSETSNETSIAEDAIDTSNWKTYKNDTYGFEVRYPRSWVYREDIIKNNVQNVDLDEHFRFWFPFDGKIQNCPVFDIRVYDLPDNKMNLEDLLHAKDIANQGILLDDFANSKYIIINNLKYVMSDTSAIAIYNNKFYIVAMSDPTGAVKTTSECNTMFQHILKSLSIF